MSDLGHKFNEIQKQKNADTLTDKHCLALVNVCNNMLEEKYGVTFEQDTPIVVLFDVLLSDTANADIFMDYLYRVGEQREEELSDFT